MLNFQELDPRHDWPTRQERFLNDWLGPHALLWLNIAAVFAISSALLFRRDRHQGWVEAGLVVAFMSSLLTEMFGVPLVMYVLSRWVSMPLLGDVYFQRFGHWPLTLGMGTAFSGLVLIAWSWCQLYAAGGGLAATGPYRFVRHPQYLGFLLFITGWLIHWPTVVSLASWPLIVVAFLWAATREETVLLSIYGDAYSSYKRSTGFLFPRIV
ncbi:methyltransferase [Dyella sp. C11]|uniref:methyltransferase family protein n=1 Tax=Dyella sp. C11 TaxID=2126991 RepID=UPI0013002FE6|nr:methyltransferase [Dyella sp. C11]